MLLNDGTVIFSLYKILFKFSRFNFCSCDSVCSGLFGCAVFGRVQFSFSKVGGSFRMGCFCLVIFDVQCNVLLLLYWLFIFWCISINSSSENQPVFIIVLTPCLKIRTFLPDPHHSFPISCSRRLLLKYQCSTSCLSSPVYAFHLGPWLIGLLKSTFVYLKRDQPTFAGWQKVLQCWLSREHLPIMTPRPEVWVPRFVIFEFYILSWMVYRCYKRPRGCLLSARLIQL